MLDGQAQPQAKEGGATILGLTALFASFGREASGQMLQNDSRFDFVAMLPTRSAAAGETNFTRRQQFTIRPSGWMRLSLAHASIGPSTPPVIFSPSIYTGLYPPMDLK